MFQGGPIREHATLDAEQYMGFLKDLSGSAKDIAEGIARGEWAQESAFLWGLGAKDLAVPVKVRRTFSFEPVGRCLPAFVDARRQKDAVAGAFGLMRGSAACPAFIIEFYDKLTEHLKRPGRTAVGQYVFVLFLRLSFYKYLARVPGASRCSCRNAFVRLAEFLPWGRVQTAEEKAYVAQAEQVTYHDQCVVRGFTFMTDARAKTRTFDNSGIMVPYTADDGTMKVCIWYNPTHFNILLFRQGMGSSSSSSPSATARAAPRRHDTALACSGTRRRRNASTASSSVLRSVALHLQAPLYFCCFVPFLTPLLANTEG
jgi:hypothetical protein